VQRLEQVNPKTSSAPQGAAEIFCAPLQGANQTTYFQPEVSPLATFSLRLQRRRKEFSNSFFSTVGRYSKLKGVEFQN
jgi:hypothetical protein